MSFLQFDIFCILVISPAIVPERIPISDDDNDYNNTDDDDNVNDNDDSLPRTSIGIRSKKIAVDIETSPEEPKPS